MINGNGDKVLCFNFSKHERHHLLATVDFVPYFILQLIEDCFVEALVEFVP